MSAAINLRALVLVLAPEQAKDFSGGEWYVNVHTPTNPSGEIRGLKIISQPL